MNCVKKPVKLKKGTVGFDLMKGMSACMYMYLCVMHEVNLLCISHIIIGSLYIGYRVCFLSAFPFIPFEGCAPQRFTI